MKIPSENNNFYKSFFCSSLVVHGFTMDEDGHKMSKSLGNVVDPNAVIHGDQVYVFNLQGCSIMIVDQHADGRDI